MTPFTPPSLKRFWDKVQKSDGCWEWTGWKDRDGYGGFRLGSKMERCHRLSYFLHSGKDPGILHVLHNCDNPSCVRPSHLFVGTHLHNMEDKGRKGRQAKGATHGARQHLERWKRGVDHPNARLSDAQVQEARRVYAEGRTSQSALAKSLGIAQSSLSMILRGKNRAINL